MKYDFCTTLRDEETGIVTVVDFECQIDVSYEREDGWVVNGAFLEGMSMVGSKDKLTCILGLRVLDAAEEDLSSLGALYEAVTGNPSRPRRYNALQNAQVA
jgi:hypothetical protein